MLRFKRTKSLGAGRSRFASGGAAFKNLASGLLAVSAGLLLAACQVPPHPMKSASTAAPAQTQAQAESQTQADETGDDATASTVAPKSTPLAATPAVAHGDTMAPTAARLTGDPKELLGLDNSALRRVLGTPARVRNELTAQVWQYVTGDCVVDLYLYHQDGSLKVTYVEARSHTAEPTPTGRCLKSLLERPTASAQ